MRSRLIGVVVALTVVLSNTVYAAVPPRNDIVGVNTSDVQQSTYMAATGNSYVVEHGKQDIYTPGFHDYGEQQILTDYSGSTNDMSVYGIVNYKTNKKFSASKNDMGALAMLFTGGAIMMTTNAHAHVGDVELAKEYDLINPADEEGCITQSELVVMFADVQKFKEMGTDSTEIPTTEQDIIKAIKDEFNVESSSAIYVRYNVSGIKWYVVYGDDTGEVEAGLSKAIVAGAYGVRQDGNVIGVTLKSYDRLRNGSERDKAERFVDIVSEMECIISTVK